MSFNDDISSVFEFLQHTSESNLKKMLVDQKMTEAHLRILLKIVKSSTFEQFQMAYQKQEVPRIKMSAAEANLKETFWSICQASLQSRGLIGETPKLVEPAPVAMPKAA
jgi:hypothetical protein